MRLLVLNTRYAPAYVIIRTLRPYADRVVAVLSGMKPLAWATCHAACSRLVDKRYRVPNPEYDWREARIQPENTEREEAFVRATLDICERERIDTVFPSSDPWVYVMSKNKERFERHGILVPVPDYEIVTTPMDKYKTIQAAREVGFPCPRMYLPENDADVLRISQELEPPWVIKPRFSLGSQGLSILNDRDELLAQTRIVREQRGMPTIQEYIPGQTKQNFYLVMGRDGSLKSIVTPRVLRTGRRIFRVTSAAVQSAPNVRVETVRSVTPEPSGKFRLVVSGLSDP